MKQLEQLPQIADQALSGLNATPEMRTAIQMKYLKQQKQKKQFELFAKIAAPVLCGLLLVSLILFPSASMNQNVPPSITSLPLGQMQALEDEGAALVGEVSVSNARTSGQNGIWEASSPSFPLIGVNGRYYRMVTTPSSLSSSSAGRSLGKVEEYTMEPALSDSSMICSNCVYAGNDVFEIAGMGGTFVCAHVDGQLRLFQRVSFNGHATIGHESLLDTLQISGHIRSMSLSGIGTVSDADSAEKLFSVLTQNATFQSTGSLNASSILTITLDDGLTAQMLVSDDRLAACGVWSCPEFIDAFSSAVNQ